MIVDTGHLPRRVYGVAQFVVGKRSIESPTVPLVQRLIGLQTVNKVRVCSETYQLLIDRQGSHEVSSKSNEVTCAAADRLGKVVWTIAPSRQQFGRSQSLLEGLQRDILAYRHSDEHLFLFAGTLELVKSRFNEVSTVE